MASKSSNLLRGLLHELRLSSPDGNIKNSGMAKYMIEQFRKYQTTDMQLCKAKDEMQFLGNTYLTYLRSLRQHKAINAEYKGRGERSIKDTADLVGFKLPHDKKP
ncbi:protein FMC1 homolog [Culicoides brevitarsis]|uniref:protein FMC1 homolog n=1 Tax=Culicoides brevitarsis TaxID=469753 RepID=UPI00307C856F